MKNDIKFKNRFRILKGGKVSLVVSAILLSSCFVGETKAADLEVGSNTNSIYFNTSSYENLYIIGDAQIGSITNNADYSNDVVEAGNLAKNQMIKVNSGRLYKNITGVKDPSFYTQSRAIAVIGNSNGKIVNDLGGTIDLNVNVTKDGSTDLLGFDTTAIYVNDVITQKDSGSAGYNASIVNHGNINVYSVYNINTPEDRDQNIEIQNIAKGASINAIKGDNTNKYDNSIVYKDYGFFENHGKIDVISTLNFNFSNDGIRVSTNQDSFAKALGLEVTHVHYSKIINDGEIKTNALVNIAQNGDVYTDNYAPTAYAAGIEVLGRVSESDIMNYNSISSTATNNGGDRPSATSHGIYIQDGMNDSKIYSRDILSIADSVATHDYSTAVSRANGIEIDGNIDHSIIYNLGNMKVEAKATNTSDVVSGFGVKSYASGISLNLIENTTLTNDGTIDVLAKTNGINGYTEASGIDIYELGEDNLIENIGLIKVSSQMDNITYEDPFINGILVAEIVSGNTTITNIGTIDVNANNSSGTNNALVRGISFYSESGVDDDANFILNNSGTIQAQKDGQLDNNGYSLRFKKESNNSENIVVNNNYRGFLRGNIHVDGKVNNGGTIELAYNSAFDGTNGYIQDFINESTGKLIIGLKTDGTTKEYSLLKTKNILFKDNSTIGVNVLSSSTNVALLEGSTLYNVVSASNSLNIEGKLNVTDNSALIDFKYETTNLNGDSWVNGDAGKIHLNIVKAKDGAGGDKTILSETKAGNGNQNSQNAAVALQGVYDNSPEVANAFNRLSSDTQIASAVQSTTPLATTSSVGAGSQIANGISTIVSQRQNANIGGNGGLNSGDGMFSENNLWIKPFAGFGKQGNKNNINGFDLKTYGLGFGFDTEYKDNQKVGLALFYTNGKVDTNSVNQTADLDVFTGLVYGNIPIIDDKTNFLYQAGYSVQKTNTKREVFTGQTAEAKYNSKIASLDLKLMRDVNVSDNFLLQPLVNTTYRHFKNPFYSESGSGALNLNVDKFKSSEFIVGLGTLAHYKLTDSQKLVGNINVGYDLKGDNNSVTSSYMGASGVKFGTDGIDNGRWSYEAGIGYELDINKRNNINISYDYQAEGTKFKNNVVSAKYVLKF
ncbi:autotransporter family protein [Aliarcobacter cryaerophilus]|uniref:autotransporter family protein n=1 Tax=Aliarcobacter cryaerophilus TaxID=28198 RepID=UPI0013DDEE66|nr:autotransporter outer membrane beta-barrel domain-containing protein [Aliarcobacter cryaerophilus]